MDSHEERIALFVSIGIYCLLMFYAVRVLAS